MEKTHDQPSMACAPRLSNVLAAAVQDSGNPLGYLRSGGAETPCRRPSSAGRIKQCHQKVALAGRRRAPCDLEQVFREQRLQAVTARHHRFAQSARERRKMETVRWNISDKQCLSVRRLWPDDSVVFNLGCTQLD